MSGITDFLKKDVSFKRKPSAQAEAATPKQEETQKDESPKRNACGLGSCLVAARFPAAQHLLHARSQQFRQG